MSPKKFVQHAFRKYENGPKGRTITYDHLCYGENYRIMPKTVIFAGYNLIVKKALTYPNVQSVIANRMLRHHLLTLNAN